MRKVSRDEAIQKLARDTMEISCLKQIHDSYVDFGQKIEPVDSTIKNTFSYNKFIKALAYFLGPLGKFLAASFSKKLFTHVHFFGLPLFNPDNFLHRFDPYRSAILTGTTDIVREIADMLVDSQSPADPDQLQLHIARKVIKKTA